MFALIAGLVTVAAGLKVGEAPSTAFDSFLQKYGRSYRAGSAEYKLRLARFNEHMAKVESVNSYPGAIWRAGAGPFADYSTDELAALRGWFGSARSTGGGSMSARQTVFIQEGSSLPKQVDKWNKLDNLFARDQGACGSCWAITSATVLSAHAEIYNSSQMGFSTQELVDCVPNPRKCGGKGGCQGATAELAFDYAMKHGLVEPSADLYTAKDQNCKFPEKMITAFKDTVPGRFEDLSLAAIHGAASNDQGLKFGMQAWEKLPENKYEPLLRALYERGPVAVSVDASDWQLYEEGIFDGCNKDAVINHAVTMIGYGEDAKSKKKYWLIQNSWGELFGEEGGRIRLLRRDDDEKQCGIDHQPQDGTACEGGPKQVTVCGMCGILYDNVVPHFAARTKN
eukprot:CAMPEP_0197655406 /NCGR_PEP_ID=MMETSP1338-20131121/39434_1 /TAXON_ID=43686 ORGANISM="Pelagodinium beii, Strain RCC1491" /NCGR_SAMPLE_ID=MMETSP1338 /ASSEMBLY_ACC=CAM_ASM_000754 /LENGTH=396 /DNA_ID=CAMNT_0043231045 /DNA_START=194 /DNA_END=1384 /DNA_ORIENTATION=+